MSVGCVDVVDVRGVNYVYYVCVCGCYVRVVVDHGDYKCDCLLRGDRVFVEGVFERARDLGFEPGMVYEHVDDVDAVISFVDDVIVSPRAELICDVSNGPCGDNEDYCFRISPGVYVRVYDFIELGKVLGKRDYAEHLLKRELLEWLESFPAS